MRKLLLVLMTAVLAFAAASALAQEDSETATFRVAHFATDAGPVDVFVDGEALLEGVEFGTISSWLRVPAGTYAVDIAPAGTSADDAVISAELTLEAGETYYTAAAVGFAERPDISPLGLRVITEDYSTINPSEARVTIFHAIPTAGPVSVFVNQTPLVEGLAYPSELAMTTENVDGVYSADVIAGTYDVSVQSTANPDVTFFDLPATNFAQNRNYFIAAVGTQENPQLILIPTNPVNINESMEADAASGPSNLRVAHFAEDAPLVDIYVDGSAVLEGIEYPTVSAFLELEAGTYEVAIVPTGAELEDAVISEEITLEAETAYTASVIGLIARDDLTGLRLAITENDYSELATGTARFSVYHVSPGSPPVDLLVNGEVFVASLAYPGFLGDNNGLVNFDVVARTYDIQITEAGNPDNVLIDLPNTTLTAGNQYFIAAINSLGNMNFFLTSETR